MQWVLTNDPAITLAHPKSVQCFIEAIAHNPSVKLSLEHVHLVAPEHPDDRSAMLHALLALFSITLAFIWFIFRFGAGADRSGIEIFSNVMYIFTSLLGAFWSLYTAYRARRAGPLSVSFSPSLHSHQVAYDIPHPRTY